MKKFIVILFSIIPSLALAEPVNNIPKNKPIYFNRSINDDELKMYSAPNHSGAFTSMIYRGVEYIDKNDHGRLLQGAIAYNDRFECNNPTQAGAGRDEKNFQKRSTSRRINADITPNGYNITTQMAYWMRPKQECVIPNFGKSRTDNKVRLSDTIYKQNVSFEDKQFPNIANIKISYFTPNQYKSAVVEALTIHTPTYFTEFNILTPDNKFVKITTPDLSDETPNPVIISTNDNMSAIGFYGDLNGYTYARWRLKTNSKISLVYRENNGFTGNKVYEAYWIIGTLEEVKAAMLHLRNANKTK